MTKKEVIHEAWGSDYERNSPDENGWSTKPTFHEYFDFEEYDTKAIAHGIYLIRPKSIRGIENNNGWTKIESEDDLPNIKGENITFFKKNIITTYPSEDVLEDKKTYLKYSHFRIKEKFLLPIY